MIVRVFDTESDGFARDATRIWCIACRDLESRVERFFDPDQIEEGLRYLMEADIIVAHNYFGHDLPLIKRLYPWFEHGAAEDSLILSRLYNPDRAGHSIDWWGQRFGLAKPVHEDWTQYSEDMKHRCIEDTRINVRVVRALLDEGRTGDWASAISTEYRIQQLQNRIEERGFRLDIDAATALRDEIAQRIADIEDQLDTILPPNMKRGTLIGAPFKKNGDMSVACQKWVDPADWDSVCGPFCKVIYEPMNLGSSQQVNGYLLTQGWEPTEWNYVKAQRGGYELNPDGSYKKSSPKLSEDSMDSITGEGGKLIAEWRVLRHRIGLLDRINQKTKAEAGWLHEVRPDGRVEGRAIPLGTNTGRYTHSGIVNVPRPGTPYGEQLRGVLTVTDGYLLAGTDASGLEARVAGHYTSPFDGGAYAKELLEGDVHSRNAAMFSSAAGKEVSRNQAKTIYYALLYGAQARKIATELGVPLDAGYELQQAFWDNNPALAEVREAASSSARGRGFVDGVDGRRIITRSPHSAMNAQFQSAGAIIMKHAFLHVFRPDDPWYCVLTMHDEAQAEVLPDDIETHKARWAEAGELVTENLSLNVPIIFDTQVGVNYAETH